MCISFKSNPNVKATPSKIMSLKLILGAGEDTPQE